MCMPHDVITSSSHRLRCDSVSAADFGVPIAVLLTPAAYTGKAELKEDEEVQKISKWLDVCTGGRRKLMGGGLLDVSRPCSCEVLLI